MMELLQSPPLLIAVAVLAGLLIGSFLNVVIYRLPVMLERDWRHQCAELTGNPIEGEQERFNLVVPRSRCPHCRHPIGALENIPLFSWLIQKGRCRHCSAPISMRYPAIELLTGVLSGVVAWHFGPSLALPFALLLTWGLIALSFIDIDHQLLPDNITMPLLWLGLLLNLQGIYIDTQTAIIGATAGYLSLWSVYHLFKLLTGKEGMGYGDFKLLALFGAWFGWQLLPLIILLSSVVGAVVGITLVVLHGRDRNIPIPFGPYLAAAGWLAMIWGDPLIEAYLQASIS